MEYKSKYKASEIDAKLSQVFDSTLQTKEVEVSEDTTIKADEGFLALKEVSVKVSGGGGSASKWKYYDLSAASSQPTKALIGFCSLVKTEGLDNDVIGPSGMSLSMPSIPPIKAMAFEMSLLVNEDGTKELMTLESYLDKYGLLSAMMPQGAAEITESEFYSI